MGNFISTLSNADHHSLSSAEFEAYFSNSSSHCVVVKIGSWSALTLRVSYQIGIVQRHWNVKCSTVSLSSQNLQLESCMIALLVRFFHTANAFVTILYKYMWTLGRHSRPYASMCWDRRVGFNCIDSVVSSRKCQYTVFIITCPLILCAKWVHPCSVTNENTTNT